MDTIAALEVMAIIVLFIVLYGTAFETKIQKQKTQMYIVCTGVCIVTVASDLLSRCFEGSPRYKLVITICECLACFMGEWIVTAYFYYLTAHINEINKVSYGYAYSATVMSVAGTVFTIVGTANHQIFDVVDGVVVYGKWYDLCQMIGASMTVYAFVALLINCRKMDSHDAWVFVAYFLMPVLATILEFIDPDISLTYVAVALSMLLTYVMVQAREINDSRRREKTLIKHSFTDELTGLQNRRSFDECCKSMGSSSFGGIIFCDLNRLKYTNDNFGHDSGDALIVSFSELLKSCFSFDRLFRISGDEFLIVYAHTTEEKFLEVTERLRKRVADREDVAAVGAAYGSFENIIALLKNAEQAMYLDKDRFYSAHPDYIRRS